jgi:hypothetical protein
MSLSVLWIVTMVTPSPQQSLPTSHQDRSASPRNPTTDLVSPSLLVSLAATPWLLTIVAIHATNQLLEQIGLSSEEIFRGDRLPVIHIPVDITTIAD